ncbi:MAG: cell division protein ZapA [Candidatus Dadabacteria bacterium]|nr:cell division protein ZapA [Candidatus Dadabacteria bacterium]MCY4042937.1 cell division protein ZapA [Candidatus Dadabacteria bacterium]MCY4047740.1 cell division protein ZapA [Candidatus Dadabacteria bacterium]
MRDVDINAFGARFRVRTEPENEQRVKNAAQLLEKRVEEVSADLKRTMSGRIPDIIFYAALGIAEELIMSREQIEDAENSKRERDERLRQVVDKSLISKFTKLKMAYGAERKGDG